jgi:two-component system, chemotaxis family, CheB/CheR fusion protein
LARAGYYLENISADVSAERIRRFFTKTDDHYQIARLIRDLCVFAKHDLIRDPPFSRLDLISCRNVLIYFGQSLHRRALSLFHYALKPRGFLVLGPSETAGQSTEFFEHLGDDHRMSGKIYPIWVQIGVQLGLIGLRSPNESLV